MISDVNWNKLKKFKAYLKNGGYSQRTIYNYENTLCHLFEFVGKEWYRITSNDIEAFKTAFREGSFCKDVERKVLAQKEGLRISSMSRQISALNSFFRDFAEKDDVVKKARLKIGKRVIKAIYSRDQIKKMFSVADVFEGACLALGYYWALRVSEAVSLERDGINTKTRFVTGIGKGDKEYRQKMLPQGFRYLKRMLKSHNYDSNIPNLLQRSTKEGFKPMYLHKIEKLLRHVCLKAGVPYFAFHSLRHSIATHLIESGWDIREVQKYLRHDDVRTTTRYLHEENVAVEKKGYEL